MLFAFRRRTEFLSSFHQTSGKLSFFVPRPAPRWRRGELHNRVRDNSTILRNNRIVESIFSRQRAPPPPQLEQVTRRRLFSCLSSTMSGDSSASEPVFESFFVPTTEKLNAQRKRTTYVVMPTFVTQRFQLFHSCFASIRLNDTFAVSPINGVTCRI